MNNSKFSNVKSQNQTTDEKHNQRNNKQNKYEAKFLNSGTKTGFSGISGIKKAVAIGMAAASVVTMSGEASGAAYTAANNPADISWNVGGYYEIAVGGHFGVGNNTQVFAADTFDTDGANTINFQMNGGSNAEIAEIKNNSAGNGILLVGNAAGRLTVKKVTTEAGKFLDFWVNNNATLFLDLTDQVQQARLAGDDLKIFGNANSVSFNDGGIFRVKGDYDVGAKSVIFNKGIDSRTADLSTLIVDGTGVDIAKVGAVIFKGQVGANNAVTIKIGGTGGAADGNHAILQFDTDNNAVNTNGVTFYSSDSKLKIVRAAPVVAAPLNFIATDGIKSNAGVVANTKGGGGILELVTNGDPGGNPANGLVVKQEIGNGGAGLKGMKLEGNHANSLIIFEDNVTLGGEGNADGKAGSEAFLTINLAKTTLADQKSIYVGGEGGAGAVGGGAGGDGGAGTVIFDHGNAMTFKLGDGGGASIFQIGGVGGDGAGANAGGNGGNAEFTLSGNELTITSGYNNTKLNLGGKGGTAGGDGGAGGNATLTLSKNLTLDGNGAVYLGGEGGAGANGGNGGAGGDVTINVTNVGAVTLADIANHKFQSFGGTGGAGNAAGNGGKGGDLTINLNESLTLNLNNAAARPFGGTGGAGEVGGAGNGGAGGDFTLNFNDGGKAFEIQNSVSPLGGTGGKSNTKGAAGGNATIVGADNAASTLTLAVNSTIGGTGGGGANNGNGGAGGMATLQLRGGTFTITNAISIGGTGGKAHNTGTGGAGGIGVIEVSGNDSTLTLSDATKIGGVGGEKTNNAGSVSGNGGAGYLVGTYNEGAPNDSTATSHALLTNYGLQFGNDGKAGGGANNVSPGKGGEGFVHLGANFTTSANSGSLIIGGKGGAGTDSDNKGGDGGKGTLRVTGANDVVITLDGAGEVKIGGTGGAADGTGNGGAGGEGQLILANDGTFNQAVTIGGKGGAGGANGGNGGAGKITATAGTSSFAAAVIIGGDAGANGNADGGNAEINVDGGATLTFENALTLGGAKVGGGTIGASIFDIKNGTVEIKAALTLKASDDSKITLGDAGGNGTLLLTAQDARDLKEFKGGIEFKSADSAIKFKGANGAPNTLLLPSITADNSNPKGILEIDGNGQDVTIKSANNAGAVDQEFAIGKIDTADANSNRSMKNIIIKNSNAGADKTFTFTNANDAGTINSAVYTIDATGANGHTLGFKANSGNTLTVKGNVVTSKVDKGILNFDASNNASSVVNFTGNIGTNVAKLKGLSVITNNNVGSKVNITGNVYTGADGIKLNTQVGIVTFNAKNADTNVVGNIARDINNYRVSFDTATNNTLTFDGTIDAGSNVFIKNTSADANAKTIFKKKSESAIKIGDNATLEINPNVDIAAGDFNTINAVNTGNGALIINTATNGFVTNAAIGGANAIKTLSIQGTKDSGFSAITLSGAGASLIVSATGTNTFGGAVTVGNAPNNEGTIEINGGRAAFTAAVSIGNGVGAGKLTVKKGNVTFDNAAKPTLTNVATSQILIGDGVANTDASVSIEVNNDNYVIGGAATTEPVKLVGTGSVAFVYKLSGHDNNPKTLTFGGGTTGGNNGGIHAESADKSTFEVSNNTNNSAGVLTIDGHVGYKGNPDADANANNKPLNNFVVTGQSQQNSIVNIKGKINVKNLSVKQATFKLYNGDVGGAGTTDSNVKADTILAPLGVIEVRDGELKHSEADKQVELGTDQVELNTIKFINTNDRNKDGLKFQNVRNLEYAASNKTLTLNSATFKKLDKVNFSTADGKIIVNDITGDSGTIGVLSSTDKTMGDFTIQGVENKLTINTIGAQANKFKTFNVGARSQFTSRGFYVENAKVANGSTLKAGSKGFITTLDLEDKAILNVGTTGYDVGTLNANGFTFGVEIGSVVGSNMSTGRLKIASGASVNGNVEKIELRPDQSFDADKQRAIITNIALNSATGVESNQIFEYADTLKVDAFEKTITVDTVSSSQIGAVYDPKTRKITTKLDPKKVDEAVKEQAKEIDNAVKNITEETRQALEETGISEDKVNALQEFNFTTESDEFKAFADVLRTNAKSDAGQLGALLDGIGNATQEKKVRVAELVASIDLDQIAEQVTSATTSQVASRVDEALSSAVTDAVNDSFSDEMDISASSPIETKYSASGDENARKTGLWMKSFLGNGEKKHATGVSGFKSDIKGITVGVDTVANDKLIVGGAITFAGTNMKMKGGIREGNKVGTNSKIFSLYGSYALGNNVFFSLIGSYGSNNTEVTEDRATLENFNSGQRKDVKSEYGSNMYSLNTKLMYKHVADRLVLTPSAGLNFSRANDEGYSEKGIDTAKTYDSKYLTRVNLVAGVKAAYNFGNIVPEVHVNLTQKVAGKDPKVGYKLDGFGDFRYSENTKKLAATSYNVGGSITYKTDTVNVGVGVDGNFASKYKGYQGSLNLRIKM